MNDDGARADPLMTLWTTGESCEHVKIRACAQKHVHAAVRDLDAIGFQVHQLPRHLVFPSKRNFTHDTGIKARNAQSTDQEYAHVTRGNKWRQKLQRLLGVQSGAMSFDQFERGPQQIVRRLDKRAQVDPEKCQENVVRFGARLKHSLAISIGEGSEVVPQKDDGQHTAPPCHNRVACTRTAPRRYHAVPVFQGESPLPQRGLCGRKISACVLCIF